jgi:hypothetical protein
VLNGLNAETILDALIKFAQKGQILPSDCVMFLIIINNLRSDYSVTLEFS